MRGHWYSPTLHIQYVQSASTTPISMRTLKKYLHVTSCHRHNDAVHVIDKQLILHSRTECSYPPDDSRCVIDIVVSPRSAELLMYSMFCFNGMMVKMNGIQKMKIINIPLELAHLGLPFPAQGYLNLMLTRTLGLYRARMCCPLQIINKTAKKMHPVRHHLRW